jgi:hypothetical protein
MNLFRSGSWIMLAIAVLGVIAVLFQRSELHSLQAERARVTAERAQERVADLQTAAVVPPANAAPPLNAAERLELMNLRRRVTELSEVKRRMASVQQEQVALKAESVALSNRLAKPFPPGWMKRSQARNRGFSTPEAAFETWVWSVDQRNQETLFAAVVPEMRERLTNNLGHSGPEGLWKSVGRIPGFLIRKVTPIDATHVELTVEIAPDTDVEEVTVRLVDGGWRMMEL